MSPHLNYFLVDLICIFFPFVFSFHPKLRVDKYWKKIAAGTLCMMALFIPWDILFTEKSIWRFNDAYTLGSNIINLPIEEWAFFICIPYACTFTYICFKTLLKSQPLRNLQGTITYIFIALTALLSALYSNHWYTLSACSLLCVLLIAHQFIWKSNWLGYFYFSWTILQIPFFISNGVLTGLQFWKYPFINLHPETVENAIVLYDNQHNLGIRIWSVPLDDFFYGMLMTLIVISVVESDFFKKSTPLKSA